MRKILLAMLIFSFAALPAWGTYQVRGQQQICDQPHQDVSTPLIDLGSEVYIRMDGQNTGFSGGLYPNGSNQRPASHEAAGIPIGRQIVPLDENGNPDPQNGKIVMLSIGVSNTYLEFAAFNNLVRSDPEVNPHLFLVNGAQDGQASDRWVDPAARTWQEVFLRLATYNKTPAQVQIAWIKQTRLGYGEFPDQALALQSDLEAISRNLKTHFPNIKLAYLSSRTRSYRYWRGLSPEPTAFETGFAVKWLVEKQINGDPELNYDPASGEVKAPYLSWGPYIWIDGLNPRSDGRTWTPEDMTIDCTHPSQAGSAKVAEMLMEFFKNDTTTTPWFLAGQSPEPTPTQIFLPTVTNTRPAPTAEQSQPTPVQAQPSPAQAQPEEPALAPTEEAVPGFSICGIGSALTALLFAGLVYRRRC